MDALIDLERRGWEALSTSRDAAIGFYRRILDADAITVFPGGIMQLGRDAILDAIDEQPWQHFDLSEARVRRLGSGGRVIVYRVRAERADHPAYEALVSSAYTWATGQWKLTFHQQTPG